MIIEIGEKKLMLPRAKAGAFRKALQITQDKDLTKMNSSDLDGMVEFCCEALDHKITVDEFYEEVYADEMVEKINEIMSAVVGTLGKNK